MIINIEINEYGEQVKVIVLENGTIIRELASEIINEKYDGQEPDNA